MKAKVLFFCLTLFAIQSIASDSLRLIRSIPVTGRLLSSDHLGNVYLVKDNNSLLRFNTNGDSLGTFNEIKKGKITQIDASNPLKILLYFADYNQIVVLNNMLTQKNVIRLNSLGQNNVSCISNSADGNIWLYDAVNGALLKIDEQRNITQNTNLRNLGENSMAPTAMFEENRMLYIADTIDGIRKFDQFGFYSTTYPIKTNNLQFFNEYLVYFSYPYLISYNTKSFSEQKLILPNADSILQTRVERGMLFILREDRLDLYQMNEN